MKKICLLILLFNFISCNQKNAMKPLANIPEKNVLPLKKIAGKEIFIRIFKEEDELEVWVKNDKKFILFKTYPICAWSGSLGPKLKEGDGQSPEGFYFVKKSQLNPNSSYHLAFNIGYPNHYDQMMKRTGSFIMVHGGCASIGCYAMTDPYIEEIYFLADEWLQQNNSFFRIHIFPFRMNKNNMKRHKEDKWYSFWRNLKQGYDIFEQEKIPPNVTSADNKYTFN